MTDLRKAADTALEALKEVNKLSVGEIAVCLPAEIDDAMEALRQALAQPEQEPVCFLRETAWSYEIAPWDDPNGFPVYTAPPKREWVGLTDDERKQIVSYIRDPIDWVPAVEAKLQEKNSD